MIRVTNIISDTNIGGAGHVIVNYLKHTDKNNFETSIILPCGSKLIPKLKPFGVKITEIDGIADKSLDLKAINELKKAIREINPDIVHAHGSMSGRIAGKQCRKKVVFTRHSVFPVSPKIKSGPGHLINKIINEHYCDRAIAVSPAAKENLTDGGMKDSMIDIIMNGVDPVLPISDEKIKQKRNEMGISENTLICSIPARIEHYKGHKTIVEAAKILKDRNKDFVILIAGTGSYVKEVEEMIEKADISDKVKMLGFVSDIPTLLSITDLQINASYATEATSLSLLEGMSIGLPTVASDYGGNPYIVREGENGYIFPQKNAAAMADAIERIIDNREKAKEMGLCAKVIYEKEFTGQIFAGNIEKVYYDLMKGKKK